MTATPEQLVLREAALAMRVHHPVSHPRHEMWEQMAHLLEHTAIFPMLMNEGRSQRTIAVARAYLAAVDRPDIDGSTTT